jgi:peroxiredoxin
MPVGWAIAVVVLGVAVIVLAAVVLGLMRQVTPLLERLAAGDDVGRRLQQQGPAIGHPLPDFTAAGPDGEVTSSALRGRSAILLFLSPGCGPCQLLASEMSQADLAELGSQLIVITTLDGQRALDLPTSVAVLAERGREVSDKLSVMANPFAVAIGPDGTVLATRVPNTLSQLSEFAIQPA